MSKPGTEEESSWDSEHDGSSTNLSGSAQEVKETSREAEFNALRKRDAMRISTWKHATMLVIVLVAVVVAAGTYIMLDRQEEKDFKTNVSSLCGFGVP